MTTSARARVEPAAITPLVHAAPGALPSARDLLLQALLHLPRIAGADGTLSEERARCEIERLRVRREALLEPLRRLALPPVDPLRLDELEVRLATAAEAAPVLDVFHYLGSTRRDASTVGAFHQGRVVALCSVSPMDLPAISNRLPLGDPGEAAVVSRVFAFDWAPRNVVSYLLARVESSRDAVPASTRMLLTYVNPNMGFSGSSYRAANWLPFGRETGTRYAYLDGQYVTDRQVAALASEQRAQVQYSRMRLRPLTLLCRLLDRRLQRAHPSGFDVVVARAASRAT